jgi:glycosyltransferase involved in cell wall biosynthesis
LFPLVKNDDDDAMFDLVQQYLERPGWRNQIGAACREFAVKKLAWAPVARQHLETYDALAN